MKKILLASSILGIAISPSLTQAQTKVIVKPKTKAAANSNVNPYPTQNYSTTPSAPAPAPVNAAPVAPTLSGTPPTTGTVTATPPETPKKTPWKLVYYTEWTGPRFSNFDLSQTQGPADPNSSYAAIFEKFKVGYGVSDKIVLGAIVAGNLSLDPNAVNSFSFNNFRIYGSWNHMIETADLDVQQVLEYDFPTTDKSRAAGLIAKVNIKNNWTIKTALRNWFFSFGTLIGPRFYNDVSGSTSDIALGLYPWITLDLATDLQFVFEGSFEAGHVYSDSFFSFNNADGDDYIHLGLLWSLNEHIQLNPALVIYPGDLNPNNWGPFLSLTAAL